MTKHPLPRHLPGARRLPRLVEKDSCKGDKPPSHFLRAALRKQLPQKQGHVQHIKKSSKLKNSEGTARDIVPPALASVHSVPGANRGVSRRARLQRAAVPGAGCGTPGVLLTHRLSSQQPTCDKTSDGERTAHPRPHSRQEGPGSQETPQTLPPDSTQPVPVTAGASSFPSLLLDSESPRQVGTGDRREIS